MDVPLEIISRYRERRKSDLEKCLASLKTGNFVEVEKVGHQLKGNGVTFGHPELTHLGADLEIAAKELDLERARQVLDSLARWLAETSV